MNLQRSTCLTLYGGVVILDTSDIEDNADYADYGGMLYELKKIGIQDSDTYKIDNAGNLLMYRDAYKKSKNMLKKFGVRAVNK